MLNFAYNIINNKKQRKWKFQITTDNFESYKNGNLPLVVDFWATWCGPCRMIAPIIGELANDYDGKIVVGKCDVEENRRPRHAVWRSQYSHNPLFQGGQLVDKFIGAASKDKIEEKFKALL